MFLTDLRSALVGQNALLLGTLFNPTNADYARSFAYSSNVAQINEVARRELGSLRSAGFTNNGKEIMIETVVAFWNVVYELERSGVTAHREHDEGYWSKVYAAQRTVMGLVCRGFNTGGWANWMLPMLYSTCQYLREFAIAADDEDNKAENTSSLEDAARHLNKGFTLCLSDRAPLPESRKWGTYYMANILFKTYFKGTFQLNSITLSKNVLKALEALGKDLPPIEQFPKSHIVTFKYYVGVINFLEEHYKAAEENLLTALQLCKSTSSSRNHQLILTYLIPAHLITTHQVPSSDLFRNYPRLRALFEPITAAIRSGNIQAFEAALEQNEDEYVKRRIYLTLERSRDIVLRNLFRKVFLISNKSTRIPVEDFRKAMGFSLAGKNGGLRKEIEAEEVECLLAGMIYKGLMKGYISRDYGKVVLSGTSAFPGTGV